MTAGAAAWTPVALATDLPAGAVLRAHVDDRDLAVWRGRSGAVRAWDNRCPHRGMRLSYGFVRGDSLTCIYHGWQYGTNGVCRYIPAHPDLTPPSTLCTEAFPCIECGGLIWVSLDVDADGAGIAMHEAEPLRSLTVDRGLDGIRPTLEAACFPIAESSEPGQGQFTTVDGRDGLIICDGRDGDVSRRLIIASQALPEERTALHVLTSPSASPGLKAALSRWLERVRWFAEHPEVETRSWRPSTIGSEA